MFRYPMPSKYQKRSRVCVALRGILGICATIMLLFFTRFRRSAHVVQEAQAFPPSSRSASTEVALLRDLAFQVARISFPGGLDKSNGVRTHRNFEIPSHLLVGPTSMGDCALPDLTYCGEYGQGLADPHVLQASIAALRDKCDKVEIKKSALVFDWGSNVGQFSLFYRAMGCRVVAVEPQPRMNWHFKASMLVNGWWGTDDTASVVLHERGVGRGRWCQHYPYQAVAAG